MKIMAKKVFLLFIIWSAVLAGCESESSGPSASELKNGDNFVFWKDKGKYQQALVDKAKGNGAPFTITEVALVDSQSKILRVTTKHPSDCDGKFEFIWNGSVALSYPPQVYLALKYDGECNSTEQTASTTLLLDLDEFMGRPDIPDNSIFHVINGSVTDSSNDKNVSSN